MFGYVYAPAVAMWPVGPKQVQGDAAGVRLSIDEKRAEIAQRLVNIANARSHLGMGAHDIGELGAAFEKSFRKATSGYWRGGLWDGCWRYRSSIGRHGVYARVRDQLHVRHLDHLTPSAKRFREILERLNEVLIKEEEAIAHCARIRDRATLLETERFASAIDERRAYASVKAECAELIAQTHRCLTDARRALALASQQAWPEKKHYGKRFALSAGLYLAAVTVAALALATVGLAITAIGFAVTVLIRVASLASIRGFDRERGWKATESLLESTKQLLRNEETEMRTYLEAIQAKATQSLDDKMWETLDFLKDGQQETMRRLDRLETRTTHQFVDLEVRLSNRIDGIEQRVDGKFDAVNSRLDAMDGKFDAVGSRLDVMDGKFDAMGSRLDAMDGKFDAMGSRLDAMDGKFDAMGGRLDAMDSKFDAMSTGFDAMGSKVNTMSGRFDELGGKFDVMRDDLRRVIAAQNAHACGVQAMAAESSPIRSANRPSPERANSWGYYSKQASHMA